MQLDFVLLVNWPGGQPVQVDALAPLNVPRVQFGQNELPIALLLYVPAEQLEQATEVFDVNEPGVQIVQDLAPPVEYEPRAQGEQELELAAPPNVPEGHDLQVVTVLGVY